MENSNPLPVYMTQPKKTIVSKLASCLLTVVGLLVALGASFLVYGTIIEGMGTSMKTMGLASTLSLLVGVQLSMVTLKKR